MGVQLIHDCTTISGSFKNPVVNRCSTCRACHEHRKVWPVTTSTGVVQVTRCGHCDGPDAHSHVRKR